MAALPINCVSDGSSPSAANDLTDLGVDEDDGMLPLQLIALQVWHGDPARGQVKGLNNKDDAI